MSFRFYVKSTLEKLEVLKMSFFAILGALDFVNLVNFSVQKVQKVIKLQNSEPLNVLRWQILHFRNSQNCLHVKSE